MYVRWQIGNQTMGVDLALLPLLVPGTWISHNIIQVHRRSELFEKIESKLPQHDIPNPLTCFLARGEGGDPCYGEMETTPYGLRLKWTTAADLLTLNNHEGVQDNWINKGIWSYVAHMPETWPIVLYWH
jgi:hypothetical protein